MNIFNNINQEVSPVNLSDLCRLNDITRPSFYLDGQTLLSDQYINITYPFTVTEYGYCYISAGTGGNKIGYLSLYDMNNKLLIFRSDGGNLNTNIALMIPVCPNTYVTFTGNTSGGILYARFYYLEGNKPTL